MSRQIIKAIHMATEWHKGQERKGEGLPYIVHPLRVMGIVSPYFHGDDAACAAVLHDVVEDTEATIDDIEREFGKWVAAVVDQLTDRSKSEDGNRAIRKKIDLDHLARGGHSCHAIKVADLIDNSISIIKHMPKFAPVYMKEKKELMKVLVYAPPQLKDIAFEIIRDYEAGKLQ